MNTTPKTLRELAEAAVDNQSMSARQVALKAERRGYKLTHTTLNQMRSGTYRYTPKPETIRALAWLAGVSEAVAFTAAGQPVPGPPLADELPDGADNLSPKSRRVVIEMLRVLIDLENTTDANEQDDTHTLGRDHHGRPYSAAGPRPARRGAAYERDPEPAPGQEQGDGPAAGEEQKLPTAFEVQQQGGFKRRGAADLNENLAMAAYDQARADEIENDDAGLPAGIDFDLAAHPDMKLAADRTDNHFDQLGEENQDTGG